MKARGRVNESVRGAVPSESAGREMYPKGHLLWFLGRNLVGFVMLWSAFVSEWIHLDSLLFAKDS